MDESRFDNLLRSLGKTRRSLLGGSLALATGWLGIAATDARKKRKKRKPKKSKPNAFGCLEMGDLCERADQCCAGICEGKKGKRKCRAHDVGTCTPDQPDWCAVDDENLELVDCNGVNQGVCTRTTAGSTACTNTFGCADCRRDADCAALGFPPGAACAPFTGNLVCAGLCAETGGMACVYFAQSDETRGKGWR